MIPNTVFSQTPDYISLRKKNGRVIKNFYAGSEVKFIDTEMRFFEGVISKLRNDSLYLTSPRTVTYQNILGATIKDTITTDKIQISYKTIKCIIVEKNIKRRHYLNTLGKILWRGAAAYLALNIINKKVNDNPFFENRNTWNLTGTLAAGALGFYLAAKTNKKRRMFNGYKIHYIKME